MSKPMCPLLKEECIRYKCKWYVLTKSDCAIYLMGLQTCLK